MSDATGRRFLLTSLALGAAFAFWTAAAELDVVSNATGEVIPASRVKAVQHLEGGIVSEILVEEGAAVERGQPLIRLDPVRARAELSELSQRLAGLRLDLARLGAELDGTAEPAFPEELVQSVPDLAAAARAVFETRRRRLDHERRIQEAQVRQREGEIAELQQRLLSNRQALALVAGQVAISANLLGRDLTNRMAHLDHLRQQQILRTQIDVDQVSLPRAEAALAEARERLSALSEGSREQARRELSTARQSFDELSQRLERLRNVEERTVLRAPVDGTVKTLSVATEGGVIQPGQTVAEIVPTADRLIIEARLPLQDIGYVRAGQAVRVTLNTPDAAAFGHLEGRVVRVSPDAIVSSTNLAFYKVRVETQETKFSAAGRDYQLYPGMSVICSIRLGTRTIFEYVLSPWFRSLRFAFQER
jgi:adhesin transport system membrane fusion protein